MDDPYSVAREQDMFLASEPGLTHPHRPSHIKLSNSGRIEISAGNGVAIVLDPNNRTIAFASDKIRFFSQDNGLQWNSFAFNPQAHKFGQPALVPAPEHDIYDGIEAYFA